MSMIDRENLKQYKRTLQHHEQGGGEPFDVVYWSDIEKAPAIDTAIEWHEIKTRPLTDEERAEYSDEVVCIYECNLPSNDVDVLVTTKRGDVEVVEFYRDGGTCYFSDFDEDDLTAWAYLPEPYKKT